MKVNIVSDPRLVRVKDGKYLTDGKGDFLLDESGDRIWQEGECSVLRETVEDAKAFAKELIREKNPRIRQQWEHDYYNDLKEQYCSAQVAGAMLSKVWEWTKETEDDDD